MSRHPKMNSMLFVLALCAVLVSSSVQAGSAKVRINLVDGNGAAVPDALLMFQMNDDPTQQFTVDQNDLGAYEASVPITADGALWTLMKVVAPGLLPMKVDLKSMAKSGEAVQEVEAMELDPSHPVPPIKIADSGKVQIDLVLGDQGEVMQKFRAARAAAREAAKSEQAAQQTSSGAYAEAVKLYNEGNFDASIEKFQAAIEESPDDAALKTTYAGALYKAKRYEEFEAVAKTSLEANPQNPNLLMMVYSSARSRGDLPTALNALLSVRELGGGADLLPHLDFVSKKMGATAQAVPAYEAILDLSANNLPALAGLATVHEMNGRPKQAQSYLEKIAVIQPDGAYKLYYDQAKELLNKDGATDADVDRAIDLLERAVKIEPDSVDALQKLGMTRWAREDHAGAVEALKKYLRLKPDADDREKIAAYLNSQS